MDQDIEAGKILGSMHLGDNIHAVRFREGMRDIGAGTLNFIKNPIKVREGGEE